MILCDKCNTEVFGTTPEEVSSPEQALGLFAGLREKDAEWVQVAFLDARNRVLAVDTVSIGGLRATIIKPRDIFAAALKWPTAALIMAHNHPSGDPNPSKEDLEVTQTLAAACQIMGLELLDHLIVTRNGFSSLRELGHL